MSAELTTHVVQVGWAEKEDVLAEIRRAVFVEEQSVPPEVEWDGEDPDCWHFLALNSAGQALGCARLQRNGKVGRMAVLKPQRGLGLGRELLAAVVETASAQGLTRLYLHAQDHAEEFYRRQGFLTQGAPFMEAGITHVAMEMALAIPFTSSNTGANSNSGAAEVNPSFAPAIREHQLESDPSLPNETGDIPSSNLGALAFSNETAAVEILLRTLASPRRRLIIYSDLLDPVLLDRNDVIGALSDFVRRSPSNDIRILLHSSQLAVSRGHRLVEFARRLPSKVIIRKVQKEYANEERCYLSWDQSGYYVLPNAKEYVGFAHDADQVLGKRISEEFEFLWQRSESDPELRVLGL